MKSKSKKLTGTVTHVDLEGGYYTLHTASGDIYKLDGGSKDLLIPGVHAEVDGEVNDKGFGISFGTPTLKVRSSRVISKSPS